MEVCIGPERMLQDIPKLIQIDGNPYIINVKENNEPVLYSAICPHMHGTVSELGRDLWRCPNHLWTYNPVDGKGISSPHSCLESFPVKIRNGELFTNISTNSNTLFKKFSKEKSVKITLVSNASLLIESDHFKILTDPWIEGPAYLGSWTHYPPSPIKIKDLPDIDAVWISHEHSDHFHEHSLSFFNKDIPMYIPDFDNERLVNRVKKLGFSNVVAMHPREPYSLTNDVQMVSFKSGSVWNDNILLLQLGNFNILNINDAGFNWQIKDYVENIDMLCAYFSGPGSSYPLTWTHLDEETKQKIMVDRNNGLLKMLKHLVDVCHPRFLLPFAVFNELYYPDHRDYVKKKIKNNPHTVKNFFKNSNDVEILDLIPGESWDTEKGITNRNPNHDKFFDNSFLLNYLDKAYEVDRNKGFVPTTFSLTHDDVKHYFEEFSGSKIANDIGRFNIALSLKDKKRELNALISFNDGIVMYHPDSELHDINMTISCPGAIAEEIITNDLMWDEANLGYWITFSRNPDVYNIPFMKLLHTPWQARVQFSCEIDQETYNKYQKIAIADIIEKNGKKVIQVLKKFGLYCTGCDASLGENIIEGCKLHGLSKKQMNQLITELEYITNN